MDETKRTYHRLKLRFRRRFRREQRHVQDITVHADDNLDKLFFRRLYRLKKVQRFVLAWTLLLLFSGIGSIWQVKGLDRFYLKLAPVSGGVYREGLIGSYTTANPLFAVGTADVAVSRLVFSGLFRISPAGELEPDLATGYEISGDNLEYKVFLRTDVTWHDGQPFTAKDVVYTYESIKNPAVKSPLFAGWQDVSVRADGDYTVIFTLPNTLSSFHYSMINGVVPEHILATVAPADLRSSLFNTLNPVGTGPFTYDSVEVLGTDVEDRQEKVTLVRNDDFYHTPALVDGVTVRTYRDQDTMLRAFKEKEIGAIVGMQTMPDELASDPTVQSFSTPLSSQVMVFLNNSSPALNDAKVRYALLKATDRSALRQSVGYQLIESDAPFLKSHFTYDQSKTQGGYDLAEANKVLDENGWVKGENGIRQKGDVKLQLRLVSQSLTEYATIVQGLQKQWRELGVAVDAILQPEEDVQAGAIVRHDYDVLLYGISIGPDPDVFAYWHSSQADPRIKSRLNLSEYNSKTADTALESGRTRLDTELRKVKYTPFLDSWLADTPAIALYQPRFLLITRGTLEGYQGGEFVGPADRFYSATGWQVRREKVIK